jgi:hypothetical protein
LTILQINKPPHSHRPNPGEGRFLLCLIKGRINEFSTADQQAGDEDYPYRPL